MEAVWHLDVRASVQPVVFPESGELVINDFTADGRDDLVVVDVASGTLIDRVDIGSRIANGMFLTAGGNRMSTTAQRPRWLESWRWPIPREKLISASPPQWGFCRNGLSLLASWVGFDVCGFDHTNSRC